MPGHALPRDTAFSRNRPRVPPCRCRPFQCPVDHPLTVRLGTGHLFGIVRINHIDEVEITIADMADQRRAQSGFDDILLRFRMHSASRETGTQTSVGQPFEPGRNASPA